MFPKTHRAQFDLLKINGFKSANILAKEKHKRLHESIIPTHQAEMESRANKKRNENNKMKLNYYENEAPKIILVYLSV